MRPQRFQIATPLSTTQLRLAARKLARTIARDLFTNGAGDRADRLICVQEPEGTQGPKTNLGGWCEKAVADRIVGILNGTIKPRRKR